MYVCPQTLVLVDSDATVSEVNQKLVKATLKYMFYHAPKERTFCLATYGHDLDGEESYTDVTEDLVCSADLLEFEAKDSNLCDTLCEVITRWKESDFACRDIVVFTDGLEGGALSHEKEELYYLTQNSEYPVYVVMLDQDNNADAKMGLSAIAVTSGGKFLESDFPGSEGAVDRQITEKIMSAMSEYGEAHWKKYEADEAQDEETMEDSTEGEPEEGEESGEEIAVENYLSEGTTGEGVVYEYDRDPGFFGSGKILILAAALIATGLLVAVFGSLIIMKKRRKGYEVRPPVPQIDEDFFDDYELKGLQTSDLTEHELPDIPDTSDTILLSDIKGENESERATRLLVPDGPVVTLLDRADEGRRFDIVLTDRMSIGRGDCDVVITGDDALSKRHCELYTKQEKVYVRDLSSSNGTKVNGKKIEDSLLLDGDELTVGARDYLVSIA